ncbi:MAG: ribonuclease D [Gammaproteobacteria bacterium]|nr:MAG: ribonuclease D [Gammaproteobacteria bacterium]
MQKYYVQDEQQLIEICQQLEKSSLLAIDTEFVRTRTYYPKLGLLQVCNGELLALIDPVTINDLSPFWQLLSNVNIRKVLHACSEDLEVFLRANCKPQNMVDSQIMMAFLGHGLSLGYAAMVQHFTEVELDKSESRTDWLKRPLTARQIEYAQADVEFLIKVYPKIVEQLEQKQLANQSQPIDLMAYALEESQKLINKKFTPINSDQLYLDVKQSWRLNRQQLNGLKHLVKWRFERAQQRDLPLNFVVKEATLISVVQHQPSNVGAMANINGIDILDVRHQGKAMLAILRQASNDDESLFPEVITRLDQYPGYKGLYKNIKNFINDFAEKSELSVEVLASKKQINKYLSWHFNINNARNSQQTVDFLQGWRLELFGQKLDEVFAK